jgi:hypothetical protein
LHKRRNFPIREQHRVGLLFDANLSPKLVKQLADLFPGSVHLFDLPLARDAEVTAHLYSKGRPRRIYELIKPQMNLLQRAIEIAVHAHAGQVDKGGNLYVLHPLRLMLRIRYSVAILRSGKFAKPISSNPASSRRRARYANTT